jgi:hypothetical protein
LGCGLTWPREPGVVFSTTVWHHPSEALPLPCCALTRARAATNWVASVEMPPNFPKLLNPPQVTSWLDESTLGLLFGMMILVGQLKNTGLFEVGQRQLTCQSGGCGRRALA